MFESTGAVRLHVMTMHGASDAPQATQDPAFCSQCGAPTPLSSRFCSSCGQPTAGAAKSAVKRRALLALGVVAFLVVAAAALMAFLDDDDGALATDSARNDDPLQPTTLPPRSSVKPTADGDKEAAITSLPSAPPSTHPPTPSPAPVPAAAPVLGLPTITESGWSTEQRSTDGKWNVSYGFRFQMPPGQGIAEFPRFRVTARNAGGAVLDTDEVVLHEVPAGYAGGWGNDLLLLSEEPTVVEVTALSADWKSGTGEFPPLSAIGVGVDEDSLGYAGTRGEISNPYGSAADQVAVVSIFRDGAAAIIGGSVTFINNIPAGGTGPFSDSSEVPRQRVSGVEVIGMLWRGSWDMLNG